MGLTPRFKLSHFGGSVPGTINEDGQKFTGLDRLTLDRLLAAVEAHDHHYRVRADTGATDPAPTTGLLLGAGVMQGGFSYFYRYAVVDEFGNESVASAEAELVTPALLVSPGMPGLSSGQGTGTLTPGIYYYGLTAIKGTEETPLGPAVVIGLQAGDTKVVLDLPAYGAADSFRIWRMGTTEPGYTRIAIVNSPTTTYTDLGTVPADPCSSDPGNSPPQVNTGIRSYAVNVTLSAAIDLTAARSWRLYRTVYPGIYSSASLVHEVVERTSEWDLATPLVRTWRDTGMPAVTGKPMSSDMNMRFMSFTLDTALSLPDPAGYPESYPLIVGSVLHAKRSGVWVELGGGAPATTILTSPNGSRFAVHVQDDGSLATTPTLFPGPPAAPINLTVV
jgi:hypothetical protein